MESAEGGLQPAGAADAPLLHYNEATGHEVGGVYFDDSLHAIEQEQHGVLAVRAV